MGIKISFICNNCGETYTSKSNRAQMPVGWGKITPRLTVNMPSFSDDSETWGEFDKAREELKTKLTESDVYVCAQCLFKVSETTLKISHG